MWTGTKNIRTADVGNEQVALANMQDPNVSLMRVQNAHHLLLGEASHGTHEFYVWRIAITKRLIEEKDFKFIAVEGDWPRSAR